MEFVQKNLYNFYMKKITVFTLLILVSVSCLFAEGTKISVGGTYDRLAQGGSDKYSGTGVGLAGAVEFNLKKNDNVVVFADLILSLPGKVVAGGNNYKWKDVESTALVKSRLDLKGRAGVKYAFQYMFNGCLDISLGGGILVDYARFRVLDADNLDISVKALGMGLCAVADVDFFFSNHVGIRLQGALDANVLNYSLNKKKFSLGLDLGYGAAAGLVINLYK